MMAATQSFRMLMLTIALFISCVNCGDLDGYKLYDVIAETNEDFEFLQDMDNDFEGLGFWSNLVQGGKTTLLLPPDVIPIVEKTLRNHGMAFTPLDEDVERIVEEGNPQTRKRSVPDNKDGDALIDHGRFYDYNGLVSLYEKLAKKYPKNMELHYLREPTLEGRKMIWIKLHDGKSSNFYGKPVIMMESGIHAREWISPAATLWAVDHLLQGFVRGDNNKAKDMLHNYNWLIMPLTNPDGYQYSHNSTKNRMWRGNRNRHTVGKKICGNVDNNRNFDVGLSGDTNGCAYGTHPFSEPETRNIKKVFVQHQHLIVAYITVHSYSQFIMTPWGYKKEVPVKHHSELMRVGNLMADAINKTHGIVFEVGAKNTLLRYLPRGTSSDWAQKRLPGIYTYSYELRPLYRDRRGFVLPPREIVPSGQEFYNSLAALARNMNLRQEQFSKIDEVFRRPR